MGALFFGANLMMKQSRLGYKSIESDPIEFWGGASFGTFNCNGLASLQAIKDCSVAAHQKRSPIDFNG